MGAAAEIEPDDVTAIAIPEAAAALKLSPRRVRQLIEERRARSRGRGLVDFPHLVNSRIAATLMQKDEAAQLDGDVAAACGWLLGHMGGPVRKDDLDAWTGAARRWGYDEAGALALLYEAARVLGSRAPRMERRR